MYNLVVNLSSRDMTLIYITKILIYNEKRCKMRVDERTVAGDGFMLNLLTALQELSVKVIGEVINKSIHLFIHIFNF
jgi:ubiquitin conjugation factor E4 B